MIRSSKLSVLALAIAGLSLFVTAPSYAADARPLISALENSKGEPSLAPMLKNVIPAVVNISVKGTKVVANPFFDIPEEFRFMFPQLRQGKQREFRALGSGVIINADKGYIITNHHVVEDADEIKIALSDGREYEAKKIGSDPHTDLALLQLKDFKNLTQLKLADTTQLEVGDFVVAIGNPFGLGQTVTSGIVSALGRSGLNIENIENFIQTDAAINSGNSGGALVNLKGELIGINTAILGPNGGNIGIGFAIPADMVQAITNQLIENGSVRRGILGVLGTELNQDLAKSFGFSSTNGAFVNKVEEGSAAEKAGVLPGDIIFAVDGKKISSFGELRALIATLGPGAKTTISVFRDGKTLNLPVILQDTEEVDSSEASAIADQFSGASLANSDKGGVEITNVEPRSLAARYGLQKGDIIVSVNRDPVKNLKQLKDIVGKQKGNIFALQIKRGHSNIYITIQR